MPHATRRLPRRLALLVAGVVAAGAFGGELRGMRYTSRGPTEAQAWQGAVRAALLDALYLTDLMEARAAIPLDAEVEETVPLDGLVFQNVRLRATTGRLITVSLVRPAQFAVPAPAVVAIHGHGVDRFTPFEFRPFDRRRCVYKNFGTELARRGFVVIAADVGQHEVQETGRTLMGERLWDLVRCVDYLQTLPEVDGARIGCAGLSLGGEMAMWLGAMDERVQATVSAGFLTVMDQLEQNHCMCWKFPGLRERVDFADIYALHAPRPLMCQNGLAEPPTDFTVELARQALEEIRLIYEDLGAPDRLVLEVHNGGHEIALQPLLDFLTRHLAGRG